MDEERGQEHPSPVVPADVPAEMLHSTFDSRGDGAVVRRVQSERAEDRLPGPRAPFVLPAPPLSDEEAEESLDTPGGSRDVFTTELLPQELLQCGILVDRKPVAVEGTSIWGKTDELCKHTAPRGDVRIGRDGTTGRDRRRGNQDGQPHHRRFTSGRSDAPPASRPPGWGYA